MVNPKNSFWQALLFAILVFSIGLLIGFFIEDGRIGEVERSIVKSEISLLDEQTRIKLVETSDIDCQTIKESYFEFADRIYLEVKELEKYDSSNKFRDSLKEIHKKYDLLRVLLLADSTYTNRKCEHDFDTIVYFFDYAVEDIETKARQATISRILTDLKEERGSDLLLVPIAGNLDLESVNMLMKKYSVVETPAIVVNEKKISDGEVPSIDEIEAYLDNNNTIAKQ